MVISEKYQKIADSTRHLLALMHTKIHGKRITSLDREHYPIALSSLTLKELLYLVRTLAKYGVLADQQNRKNQTTNDFHVKIAAEALANWPHGLHRYLLKLGKYFQHQNGTHVGLRKQFLPIYSTLFKSKQYGNAFEFIRIEFVRFGSMSWASAVIDKKLYRHAGRKQIERFLSVSSAAQILQVSPRTLRDWCAAGLIPCKTVEAKRGKRYVVDRQYMPKFERNPGVTMDARKAAAFLEIPVSVLKKLKSSTFYCPNHSPQFMRGYHRKDLEAFKEKMDNASSFTALKVPQSESQLTLDSVLKSSKWWATDAKVNLLCAFLDGQIKPIGKATMEPLSVYFDKELILEFMNAVNKSEFEDSLSLKHAARKISCSHLCIAEMIKQKIIATSQGTGCRVVCARSLKRFDENYLALNAIARIRSTNVGRLQRLAHESQLKILEIKIPKRFITPFIERSSLKTLLATLSQECEKRLSKKRVETADDRDVRLVKQYLKNLTQSEQPLPTCGNKHNKMAIAKASGIRRNSIIYNTEIRKLLENHSKKDVKIHDVKLGSQLGILDEFLRSATVHANGSPLIRNGKPNKQRIAREAGVSRSVFYQCGDDANKLLKLYLSN